MCKRSDLSQSASCSRVRVMREFGGTPRWILEVQEGLERPSGGFWRFRGAWRDPEDDFECPGPFGENSRKVLEVQECLEAIPGGFWRSRGVGVTTAGVLSPCPVSLVASLTAARHTHAPDKQEPAGM